MSSATELTTRPATATDRDFLWRMLYSAGNWNPGAEEWTWEEMQAAPQDANYVAGWMGSGDAGVIAVDSGQPVGAAWFRLAGSAEELTEFVAADVPVIAIGIVAEHRDRGLGRRMIQELMDTARTMGYRRVALGVEDDNARARRLYASLGFTFVRAEEGEQVLVADL